MDTQHTPNTRSVRARMTRVLTMLAAVAAMAGSGLAQAQWTELTRLGTSEAICKGGVRTPGELQSWFAANRSDVVQALDSAGFASAADAVIAKVAAGDFTPVTINAGDEFKWMGARKKGKPTVTKNVRYTGKNAEAAVALQVTEGCATHDIVIPLSCCNVSLVRTSPAPPPDTPSLDVVPPASCDGGVAQVSATGPAGSDVEITLISPDGTESVVSAGELSLAGAGDYKIRASSVNSCGRSPRRAVASFSVASCPAPVAAAPTPAPAPAPVPAAPEPKKEPVMAMEKARTFIPFVAGFIGAQSRTRDLCYCIKDQTEGLLGARGGVLYPITDRLSLLGQIGGALNDDKSKWHTAHADIGLEMKVGKSGFIGGGVGVWDLNSSFYRDPTLFLHGGVDTPWSIGSGTVQWFIEGRKWLDEPFDETQYDNDYAGMTGFRLMFK